MGRDLDIATILEDVMSDTLWGAAEDYETALSESLQREGYAPDDQSMRSEIAKHAEHFAKTLREVCGVPE